jgi:hypothetical protein
MGEPGKDDEESANGEPRVKAPVARHRCSSKLRWQIDFPFI